MPRLQHTHVFALSQAEYLKQLGITCVVDVSASKYTRRAGFTYLNVDVVDESGADIASHFKRCNKFIDAARDNKTNVLVRLPSSLRSGDTGLQVHCNASVSRSPTLVRLSRIRQC